MEFIWLQHGLAVQNDKKLGFFGVLVNHILGHIYTYKTSLYHYIIAVLLTENKIFLNILYNQVCSLYSHANIPKVLQILYPNFMNNFNS
jgi:hypothetical protein